MQLVAYGAQDIYLTGSPSITFWRIVYRRHTSFAQELISQVFNGTVGWGRRVSATVSREITPLRGKATSGIHLDTMPEISLQRPAEFTPTPVASAA